MQSEGHIIVVPLQRCTFAHKPLFGFHDFVSFNMLELARKIFTNRTKLFACAQTFQEAFQLLPTRSLSVTVSSALASVFSLVLASVFWVALDAST